MSRSRVHWVDESPGSLTVMLIGRSEWALFSKPGLRSLALSKNTEHLSFGVLWPLMNTGTRSRTLFRKQRKNFKPSPGCTWARGGALRGPYAQPRWASASRPNGAQRRQASRNLSFGVLVAVKEYRHWSGLGRCSAVPKAQREKPSCTDVAL